MSKDLRFNILVRENFDRALSRGVKALRGFQGIAGKVARGIKSAFRGLFDFRTIAAGGGVLGGIGLSIKKAFDFETAKVQLKVLTGDAKTAKQAFNDLMEFSNATPFEPEEVLQAGRSLIAFGTDAKKVTEELRRVGDVASGVGAPLGELVEIYGKAQVQGRLYAEDVNQFLGRGIPILEALADVTGKSSEEVRGLISEGKVGFPELQKAFIRLTSEGGKYEGMMKELSKTGHGLFSTLKGEWATAIAEFGEGFKELAKGGIDRLSDRIRKLRESGKLKEWADEAAKAARVLADVLGDVFSGDQEERSRALGQMGEVVKAMFLDAGSAFVNAVRPPLTDLMREMGGVIYDAIPDWMDQGRDPRKDTHKVVGSNGQILHEGPYAMPERTDRTSNLLAQLRSEDEPTTPSVFRPLGYGKDRALFMRDPDILRDMMSVNMNPMDVESPISPMLEKTLKNLGLEGLKGLDMATLREERKFVGSESLSAAQVFNRINQQQAERRERLGTTTNPMIVKVPQLDEESST